MSSKVTCAVLPILLLPISAHGQGKVQYFKDFQAIGDIAIDKGVIEAKGASPTLVVGGKQEGYRVTAEVLQMAKPGAFYVQVMPADAADFQKDAILHAYVSRDGPGNYLQAGSYRRDGKKNTWLSHNDITYLYYWRPDTDKANLALLQQANIPKQSWHGRWLRLRCDVTRRFVSLWLDGRLLVQMDRPAGSKGPVAIKLSQGDKVRDLRVAPLDADSTFVGVDLTPDANARFAKPIGKNNIVVDGVPFELPAGDKDHLDLRKAEWIGWKTDPADYYENYDGGPPILHDQRMPLLRIPLADYTTAHLLAVADDDAKLTNAFTLRAGRYGWSEQVALHAYPGMAPRSSQLAAGSKIDTPAGPLFYVRIPMTKAIAQDLQNFLEVEITKELRLARRQPDPNRFRIRPLGLPSGVRIAAITFERSPLQMRVNSKESGHAFVEPQKPTFQVRLRNITQSDRDYQLVATMTHRDGTKSQARVAGKIPAGQTVAPSIAVAVKRGYHDVVIALLDAAGKVLLERHTSCALLPPDTRKHRATSPFGTWDFGGAHFTNDDFEITGPLYVKLGLRFGFGTKPEMRSKYGIVPSTEPMVLGTIKTYEDTLKNSPDLDPTVLIFHETSISGRHITRVPDLFHDRPPYQLDAEEKKNYDKLLNEVIAAAKEMRRKYPKVHLRFGNGALPTQEEFYRRKLPAELFDSGGNESPAFGRPPETQPPDCVGHNSGVWMIRQMLDAYGYKDKPVSHCYELCYPASNPGNLSTRTQADYFVRHALHSLAWNMPHIKIGCICDMGNSYYFSNWGATGFCNSKPELSVKPAFVAVATLTRVLDGARFSRILDLGSPTLYALEFKLPTSETAYALWTVRGQRPLRLKSDIAAWKHTNDQGQESTVQAKGGIVEVGLSGSAVYLVGKGTLTPASFGEPVYADAPPAKHTVLSPLTSMDDWTIGKERDIELEYYDFMCPRRKGEFAFEPVKSIAGKEGALRITPRPIKHGKDTMPMYAVLAHNKGIPVPGKPTEIGMWVHGNSGWGRLIFELKDAKGQRWISLGAEQTDAPKKWVEDMIPAALRAKLARPAINDWNTSDVFGISHINFDGWRYVAFPLPGNYPGEGYGWPANSQWRGDKDGIVHYPLTVSRLIFELQEKVLHVKTFAPPPRPEIYVRDLIAGEDQGRIVKLAAP